MRAQYGTALELVRLSNRHSFYTYSNLHCTVSTPDVYQDYNDDIRQEQLREMQLMNAGLPTNQHEADNSNLSTVSRSSTVPSSASAPPPPVMTLGNPLQLTAVNASSLSNDFYHAIHECVSSIVLGV